MFPAYSSQSRCRNRADKRRLRKVPFRSLRLSAKVATYFAKRALNLLDIIIKTVSHQFLCMIEVIIPTSLRKVSISFQKIT